MGPKVALLLLACFIVLLWSAATSDAKPMPVTDAPVAGFGRLGFDNKIIGGQNAKAGDWPWQLSQERLSTGWAHSCGASLLSSTKALSAAHCVDGAVVGNLRVIAGLWKRSDTTTAQISNLSSYTMHEGYQIDSASYSNDISILNLVTPISTTSPNVRYLTLPPNNNDNFAGDTCTITGWGRTSSSQNLPDILQQVNIGIITKQECASRMSGVSSVVIWDNHICLYDSALRAGSCQGDSGGPLNCPDGYGGYYVAGVTSFGITSGGNCLQTYPSVYTRTSAYINWIATH